jgi:hypothetical protein
MKLITLCISFRLTTSPFRLEIILLLQLQTLSLLHQRSHQLSVLPCMLLALEDAIVFFGSHQMPTSGAYESFVEWDSAPLKGF